MKNAEGQGGHRSSFFVCRREEQSRKMPVCAATTVSNLPCVTLFM